MSTARTTPIQAGTRVRRTECPFTDADYGVVVSVSEDLTGRPLYLVNLDNGDQTYWAAEITEAGTRTR